VEFLLRDPVGPVLDTVSYLPGREGLHRRGEITGLQVSRGV
jgi:hypothetical protein